MKRLFLILLTMPLVAMADNSLPAGEEHEAYLGLGYDSEKEGLQGACLKGKKLFRGKQEANISFEQSLDEKSLQKELGIDAGTRFRYGEATVKASAKFLKASRSNGFSISAVYSGDYKFKNEILIFEDSTGGESVEELEKKRLTDIGQIARKDDDRWRESCGDEYVAQIIRGAKLFYSIKIEFLTQEEKDLFEAAFSYDSSLATVKAKLSNISKSFSRRTKITVGALQIGGDTRKVTELFYDNSETGDESSLGFVQCSFGALEKCDQVMANAIRYATKDFKKQLESKPDSPAYEGGPADLRYLTKPYSAAGIYPKFSSILTASVRSKRRELEDFFDKVMKDLAAVNSLLSSETVVLSTRQRTALKKEKQKMDTNVDDLVLAAETCYNSVPSCLEVANPLIQDLHEFNEDVTIITPETFRQYCTLASSSLATNKLRRSIEGMVLAAKELDPDQFANDPEGDSDLCLQSHNVFSRNSEILTFAGKGISVLTPLEEYTHIVKIDLSGNEIEDLSPLAKWKNLEEINLSENKVRELSVLGSLRSLLWVDVSNNRLRDISGLLSLADLERVDARNNYSSVSCEGFASDTVCLSATIRTDAKFVQAATTSVRPIFLPSVVQYDDGKYLVVGDEEQLQSYSIDTNSFSIVGDLGESSHGRQAIALDDGDILITGGWLSGRSVTIFNPTTKLTFRDFDGLKVDRVGHSATLLPDGRVLLAGGWEGGVAFTGTNATHTAEIFDPKTNKTYAVGNMHAPRAWHSATLLGDGKVLLVGGFGWDGSIATGEIFDPKTNEFTQLNYAMDQGRGYHTATLLNSGKVLIAGGFNLDAKAIERAELFDPYTGEFKKIREPLNWGRAMHSAVLLNNGKVLLAGGSKVPFTPDHPIDYVPDTHIDRGELFDPVENSFIKIPSKMSVPRARHQLVEANPGTVLIIGGGTWESANQLEVFNYVDVNVNNSPN